MTLQVLIVAFVVSFLGSIPPGSINITTMQYAVLGQKRAAFYFLLACTLVEFFYTAAAVRFQVFLAESPVIVEHFLIITAVAMVGLGLVNLFSHSSASGILSKVDVRGRQAFSKGVVVGVLNPLTIPFWLAVTAYLQNREWISLAGSLFWVYLTGIALGTFVLLLVVRHLGSRFTQIADNRVIVHILPGLTFIALGLLNFFDWLF